MRTKSDTMISIDSDGFYEEYKKLAELIGGVEVLTAFVAPNNHKHYLSGCKRQGRVSRDVFNKLVRFGANKDKMLGRKEKFSYSFEELSTIMHDYLAILITSDEFKTAFVEHCAKHMRHEIQGDA